MKLQEAAGVIKFVEGIGEDFDGVISGAKVDVTVGDPVLHAAIRAVQFRGVRDQNQAVHANLPVIITGPAGFQPAYDHGPQISRLGQVIGLGGGPDLPIWIDGRAIEGIFKSALHAILSQFFPKAARHEKHAALTGKFPIIHFAVSYVKESSNFQKPPT